MTDKCQRSGKRTPQIGKLEIKKESVQELTEGEQEAVKGGMAADSLEPTGCRKNICANG